MSASIAYRPDIDGLRAVAVLSVVLCHFGVPGFEGGYVGVDVFFVISGFLITSIVLRDIATGGYSLRQFYERRARRILPAFLAVAIVTTCLALALFLPEDLVAYGKSLVASALFGTNLLFWQESSYFAAPSELKPLLHTWSLSIEEQFYVGFPLLLSATRRWTQQRLMGLLFTLLVASLGLCVWATGRQEFAFYLLPSRAWELMTGALLAIVGRPSRVSGPLASGLGVAGLSGILAASFTFSSNTTFPGIAAALPCFGAAAIILSGPSAGPVAQALSHPVPVFVGKISYSLYLWHWPLLVFAKYFLARSLSTWETVLLLTVVTLLATLSWRYVETPFRRRATSSGTAWTVLGRAGLALTILGTAGVALWLSRGLPLRVPEGVLQLAEARASRPRPKPGCVAKLLAAGPEIPSDCLLGASTQSASFALWGDSHAEAVSAGVAAAAIRGQRSGVILSKVGCPPLADVDIAQGAATNHACRTFATRSLAYLEAAAPLQRVVLAGRWAVYLQGQIRAEPGGTSSVTGTNAALTKPGGEAATEEERGRIFEGALRRTAQRLKGLGKQVFVMDPVPEIGWDVPMTLARLTWFHPNQRVDGPSRADYQRRNDLALRIISRLVSEGLITRLSPQDWLCRGERCLLREGSQVFYADGDHVSRAGSLLLAPAFAPAFVD